MKKAQLVFVPSLGVGHVTSHIEFGKRLLDREDGISITVLVMIPPYAPQMEDYIQSLAATDTRIRYIVLPRATPDNSNDPPKSVESYITGIIAGYKSYVKDAIVTKILSNNSVPLCGLVVDLFCTPMIDVARELDVPTYIFFTSGVACLGLFLSFPEKIGDEFTDTDPQTILLGYEHPVPSRSFPNFMLNKDSFMCLQTHGRKYKEANGIIVNSFQELESHAVQSVQGDGLPPIFTVGPLLNVQGHQRSTVSTNRSQNDEIMKWLDDQPEQSVVFLCFGSSGSFSEPQLKEIALGLEQGGHRFLWSVRKPTQEYWAHPSEYNSFEEIMPEGFLERTKNKGFLCGWAPQIHVLAHKSIGGFVSHCGWNSILESLWYGVPIVTWPLYAEQKLNAFQMVKDLGLAVEMRLDYKQEAADRVSAIEIASSVKCLMDGDNEVRKKVKKMSEFSRQAVSEGGSSFEAFGRLINLLLANKP